MTPRTRLPWWHVIVPVYPGQQAVLRYGDGAIMRATFTGKAWRVDWCGSFRTLNDVSARRGFPPDVDGPCAGFAAMSARDLGAAS